MDLEGVTVSGFRLGPKGRVVLPAAVRRSAQIADGAELVAYAAGPGRVVIETRNAIRSRVWDASPTPSGLDVTADVRALRVHDAAQSDTNHQARTADGPVQDAGSALLAHLGLV